MGGDTQHNVPYKNQNEILGCPDLLGKLVNRAYTKAKNLAGIGIALDVCLYLGGIVAIVAPQFTLEYPWLALPVTVFGFTLSSFSADMKDKAEALKRHHEYLMGFGTPPDKSQLADLQIVLAKELPKESEALLRQGITYWSKKPLGPARTLENLVESAWFTKHFSKFCASALGTVFTVSLLLSVSLLLLCATSLAGSPVGLTAAKCITVTILFLVSVRVLRSWLAYLALSKAAGGIDSSANNLLLQNPNDAFAAERLLCEYQIARASGPLIPTWVWRLRRNTLNDAWARIKRPQ
jgi:hypothetical protein